MLVQSPFTYAEVAQPGPRLPSSDLTPGVPFESPLTNLFVDAFQDQRVPDAAGPALRARQLVARGHAGRDDLSHLESRAMPSAASEMWFDWASERILLICHTKKSPDVETWSEQCSVVGKGLARDNFGTLVLTDGGGPSSAQREQLAQATEKKRYPISVVSNASIVRFIVSSIALFNPSIHSFLPADWRRALAHLGVAPMELKAIERKLLDFAQHPQAERFTVLKSVESSIRAL